MSVSRASRAVKMIERAAFHAVEQLEARRMMTTVIGGKFGFFDEDGVFQARSNVFEYRERDGDVVRIKLNGDINAEFIGMSLGKGQDQTGSIDTTKKLVDLVPAFVGQTPEQTTDLFEIYIVSADTDATISMATVPELTATPRPMQPFTGTSGPIRISDAWTGQIRAVTTDAGTGGVYIGARTLDTLNGTTDEQDIPILSVKRNSAFGIRPAPFNGRLGAGIFTAPGVNFGKILVGGTVTGNVDIAGSIDTFYAGAVLTGDATGLPEATAPNINDNFHVGGDIRALYTMGAIGTVGTNSNPAEPGYNTGFDLEVGGKLGELFVANGDLYGAAHVRNDTKGWSGPQREVEYKSSHFTPGSATYFQQFAELGDLAFNDTFANDSFQTAQYIGTFDNKSTGEKNIAIVNGQLNTATNVDDDDDYFAVGMLAGQTVNVQLFDRDSTTGKLVGPSERIHVGVFDPDGRLIASDYSFVDQLTNTGKKDAAQGHALQFTADRPGAYRFAIATNGDTTFTAHNSSNVIDFPYQLQVRNAGPIALGGVIADAQIITSQMRLRYSPTSLPTLTNETLHAIDVDTGDIGAIVAGVHSFLGGDEPARLGVTGAVNGSGTGGRIIQYTDVPIAAVTGNIRSIEATDFGYGSERVSEPYNKNPLFGPNLYAHYGSVGLLRTWNTGGTAYLNDAFIDPVTNLGKASKGVGGDYQLIDIAGTFSGTVIANRGIGVIRADAIAGAHSYVVNADNKGNDGVIDLIDSRNDIGTLGAGGPAIVTGPGGNVRYIHAGGIAWRDQLFGAASPEETLYDFGATAELRDDSGTPVKITPIPQQTTFGTTTGVTLVDPGRLRISTYPIRGDLSGGSSGGSVIVKVIAEGGTAGAPRGIQIESKSLNGRGSVEIGTLEVNSSAAALVFDDTLKTFTQTSTFDPVDITIKGSTPVDVLDISGANNLPTSLNSLVNSTSGEIVNAYLTDVSDVNAETIGLSKSYTGTLVSAPNVGSGNQTSTYPFLQQQNIVEIAGNVATIHARQGLGNIYVGGTAGDIAANSNERNVSGVFEGFNAPIVVQGQVLSADIGEGIRSTGTGSFAQAGLFAVGKIGSVVNQGLGSDIRGAVISLDSIDSVRLGDGGSIIGGQVMVVTDFSMAQVNAARIIPNPIGSFTDPEFQIGTVKLTGKGGIIGSRIICADMGPIFVGSGGFGIINSDIHVLGDGRMDSVIADGYGIRNTLIRGGATTGTIAATGHGQQIDANKFTPSVRGSAFGEFDSLSGYSYGYINDLYRTLAIKPQKPIRGSITKAGVISDTVMNGSRSLDSLSAWGIQARTIQTVANPNDPDAPILIDNTNALYPMQVIFGDSIGRVTVTNQILGLAMSAATINTVTVGDDVYEARIASSARIRNVSVGGTFRGNSSLLANGIGGVIDSFTVGRSLFGQVSALSRIGTINVKRDIGTDRLSSSGNLDNLIVGNDILGSARVTVNNKLGTLNIGDDLNAGAVVKAKSLGAFTIGGDQAGTLLIG